MRRALSIIFMASLFCVIFSCKTKQDIDYMKNIEQTAINASVQNSTFTIQPGDQLMISISAKDNDVVKPFNQNYSSSDVSQFSQSSTNLPVQGQSSVNGPSYIVDSKGDIQYPILGELNTSGKTIEQFREILKERLKQYIKEPIVNVRNTNFKVTVLGEVTKSGTYLIPDGQSMNLWSVLGMAGDLTIYGQRKNVLIVRNIDGVTSKEYIDLTDAEFINSPYYYVKQNDVIYVSPNDTRKNSSSYGPQAGVFIAIASVVVGLLALIFR
ncbi:polysaccharide biosynthesis/export family protein [Epilithonimonas caeni]|uniref:polysaccharide biosynthesis/export family protein n=1 Tax=Epilithonimonas caeni TaxID=365343 RepID=UPI0004116F7C|nr:polysaccharide biosynthesis/export family protein [Epilithonimonas caeni]